jgi:hypothetical protein
VRSRPASTEPKHEVPRRSTPCCLLMGGIVVLGGPLAREGAFNDRVENANDIFTFLITVIAVRLELVVEGRRRDELREEGLLKRYIVSGF